VSQIIRTVEKVAGRAVPAIVAPRRAGDPPILVANPSLGNRVLGWTAIRSDLDTLVTTAFRWHTLSHERLAKATAV
jgi:UDP-glucose 4-epimerase